jgi:hypothetical protein
VRILNFPLSRLQLLINLGAAVAYKQASSSVTFLSKYLPIYATDDVVKPTDPAVRTGDSSFPPHKTDAAFKSAPIKIHAWKLPNTRNLKPKQNIFHDT